MGSVKVEDADHLGIIAGVIQDQNIIDMIGSPITPDEREEITNGEAIFVLWLSSHTGMLV